jgi:putative aldouronate transport system permease protein
MFKSGVKRESFLCYAVMFIASVICVVPILMVISTSLSNNTYITINGYTILPRGFTLDTYIFLLGNKLRTLMRAYGMSFACTIGGTAITMVLVTCYAYAVAQPKEVFRFAQPLSFVAWFTTIFSGGVLPWYIVCITLGLKNNVWAWIVPGSFSAFYMFILKNNFKAIPKELIESAALDGASQPRIFFDVALPLARSGIVTIMLFSVLGHWNSFYNGKYLITKAKLYNIQLLLNSLMSDTYALLSNPSMEGTLAQLDIPTATVKAAVTCLAIAPVMIVYPFTLKFFIKGINVGAVKG